VDHLPLSDKVPSPDKVLGYVVGTAKQADLLERSISLLSRTGEGDAARPRLQRAEKSEEGKEQILVAWVMRVCWRSSIATKRSRKLADPRKLNEQEAKDLIGEGKVFYWASGSIHSPETGSCEMLMELAYRLAVEESSFIQAIRKNVIVLITPVLEVDGRDMMVDTYNYRKANPERMRRG